MKAFLVDVDGVLFNTEKIRPLAEKGLSIDELKPYFKEFIFPDSLEVLKQLKKLGKVIVFSGTENIEYQKAKINSSGIEEAAGKDNIVITTDKHTQVKIQVDNLKNMGFNQIFVIDDRATIMEEAFKADPKTIRILISFGKYKSFPIESPEAITYKTDSIKGAYDFVITYVDSLENYQIKKGITDKQRKQLLEYTLTDKDIQKYTSDLNRFKDKESLDSWLTDDKTIYTLVNQDDDLMGIIWFHPAPQPQAPGFNITFAIRMYKSARGKGLSRPFMEKVFQDFGQKGIWLRTSDDNIPAKALYEKFGFKQITKADKSNKIIMIYE